MMNIKKRQFVCGVASLLALPAGAYAASAHTMSDYTVDAAERRRYARFLSVVRGEAIRQGMSASVVDAALAVTPAPNAKVLKADRHQPEFTLTWAQYKERVLTDKKILDGQSAVVQRKSLFSQVSSLYKVSTGAIAGIWGLESAYGKKTGTYHVIDALATLAFDGRRSSFFRAELFKALQILNQGDITPSAMLGSYAGAMGQPQFMPSAYQRYAVSFPEGGRRNIWTNEADVFASVANYLAKCHWRYGEPWGEAVHTPETLAQSETGRTIVRPSSYWVSKGVTPVLGGSFARPDLPGAIVRPDGLGGEAFIVYANFNVIRRYNPSDFYALAVGLLGDAIA